MKIQVINPNTSVRMTEMIRLSAQEAAAPGTEICCRGLDRGPEYADCAYDNALVCAELVRLVQGDPWSAEYDAYVVASFADPGLDALRELTEKPVVGIAEAAIHFSAFLGHKFAIINTMPRLMKSFESIIARTGAQDRLAAIKLPPFRVASFLESSDEAREMLVATAREAIDRDGAEVILLGGGMLAGYADFLTERVGVPALDGVKCAVKLAESLAALGMKTSKIRTYAPPFTKAYRE